MPTWSDDPYDALDEIVAAHGVRIVRTWFTQIEDLAISRVLIGTR